jgi:hypothetical protein
VKCSVERKSSRSFALIFGAFVRVAACARTASHECATGAADVGLKSEEFLAYRKGASFFNATAVIFRSPPFIKMPEVQSLRAKV